MHCRADATPFHFVFNKLKLIILILTEKILSQFWYLKKVGISYVSKRIFYIVKKKIYSNIGSRKRTSISQTLSIETKNNLGPKKFFITSRKDIKAPKASDATLQSSVVQIFNGTYPYFQSSQFQIKKTDKWHYNPATKHTYPKNLHWTKVSDFSAKEGDIKFVWEISRFCYLYDIIRYDHHFSNDSASFVFNEIEDWIQSNPPETGPNYVSGQEIALRILNWIYVLHFYSESEILKSYVYKIIVNSIHQQAQHIDRELHFAQNFVRNNHLLSESLALFTVGLIFPQFKESEKWLKKGHKIFCKEVLFQFDSNGAYLQHSFNYQRVAIQLCTWFVQLCNLNQIIIERNINERLLRSVDFMMTFIGNRTTGEVPNFGNNDGSLLFPLNNEVHTNYFPQLQAMSSVLGRNLGVPLFEDVFWFNTSCNTNPSYERKLGIFNYEEEGYYVASEENCLTFFWCPQLKNRPAQADMLHVDIWFNGENIIRDSGTYLYNTSDFFRHYFFGSRSHNTIIYNGHDVMKKGKRFIFYYWPKKITARAWSKENIFNFTGEIKIYTNTNNYLSIIRTIIKVKDKIEWVINDKLNDSKKKSWTQIWNISDTFLNEFNIAATDENMNAIDVKLITSYISPDYGILKEAKQLHFSTLTNSLRTVITKK